MSYYKLLGVPTEATDEQIKVGYKTTVLKAHPDKGGSAQLFKRIQEAYETLRSPDRRERYDAKLSQLRVIRRFATSSYRPVALKEAVKEPVVFPLLDGSSYTFETAPSVLRCKFRHGDVVRNGRGETGCFLGQASNGMYWKKEGEAFASLLFSSGLGGDNGIALVYRNKEPTQATPRATSRPARETPSRAPTPHQKTGGETPRTPRAGTTSSGYGGGVPTPTRLPTASPATPTNPASATAAAQRRANIDEARTRQLITTIKRLVANEEAKRSEIEECVAKYLADFNRAVALHRAKPTQGHPRSLAPSTNLRCFQHMDQLQRHGAVRGSSVNPTTSARTRSSTPSGSSRLSGTSTLNAPTAASRQRCVSRETSTRRASQTSLASSQDKPTVSTPLRANRLPGRTTPLRTGKSVEEPTPTKTPIPTLPLNQRVQSTTNCATPRTPRRGGPLQEVDESSRRTTMLPEEEDDEPLSHTEVQTPTKIAGDRIADPVPSMKVFSPLSPTPEPTSTKPAQRSVVPLNTSALRPPTATLAPPSAPFALNLSPNGRARSSDPPKLSVCRSRRSAAPQATEEFAEQELSVGIPPTVATAAAPVKPIKFVFGTPVSSAATDSTAATPRRVDPHAPLPEAPNPREGSEERGSRDASEDPGSWLSPPKPESGKPTEASAAFLKKLYLGDSSKGLKRFEDDEDDENAAAAFGGRHGAVTFGPSIQSRSKSVTFDPVPKVGPLTPRTAAKSALRTDPTVGATAPPVVLRSTTPLAVRKQQ